MAGHSHRHIGDIEELEHMDQDRKFIMVENTLYLTGIKAKPKYLSGYSRITIEFPMETKRYSHRYTAVYYLQKRFSTKNLFVYSYIDQYTVIGKTKRDDRDLSIIPKFLYVYNPHARIWEYLD